MSLSSLSVHAVPPVQYSRLAYHLKWNGKSSVVRVRLVFTPAGKDSTVFNFDGQGLVGQLDLFTLITNIRSDKSDQAKVLPKEKRIIVYHSRPDLQQLSYNINGRVNNVAGNGSIIKELFRPVITNGYLYLISLFFLLPSQKPPG